MALSTGAAMALGGSLGLTAGSIFGGSKKKKVKLPGQYYKAMDELLKLGKADVNFPTQDVAPLSQEQLDALGLGKEYYTSGDTPESRKALETYESFLTPDVMNRPEVKGMISKATEEGNLMLNRIGRGMVTRGSFGSTPGRDILGRGVTSIQERIASAISEYLNAAENRKLTAAEGIAGIGESRETSKLKKIGTAMDLGSLTRSIQQQIEDAKYNKLINEINMKYNTQPQILSSVMGGSVGTVEGGEPSMFAQASPMIGQILSAAIMSGGNNDLQLAQKHGIL